MTDTDKEFKEKALFDLDFEESQKKSAEYNQSRVNFAEKEANRNAERELAAEQSLQKFRNETSSLFPIQSMLNRLEKDNPTLKAQAEACLFDIINKDPNDRSYHNKKKSDKDSIDLDGSKKSLWGKLKNKAKNIWRPYNDKKTMESYIADFKKDMEAHPETYDWLKHCARPEGKSFDTKEKVSFSQLCAESKKISQYYNHERVDRMRDKNNFTQYTEEAKTLVQNKEATIEAIHQVRNKAAKEIELKAMARKDIGITDIENNTGIDRLAEKAKMMEGMSPKQRLAFRMSQLRGLQKDTPEKPAEKRNVDSNMLKKAIDGKLHD